ncbi:MAG: hypothetical protein DIU71_08570 [Proteobacteria bacterium]|nr:MAG: hypothetical protein DIU71_08570 [Pseudomonadota bacterium]
MDSVKEQLSACLDGELPAEQFELLLKRLERDPQLRHSMGRYALIGEALRAARPVCASSGFATRVADALREEAPLAARRPATAWAQRWLRPVAGMAVAASVAALAIFVLQEAPRRDATAPLAPEQIAATDASPPAPVAAPQEAASYTVPTVTPQPSLVSASPARLTNYVVAHGEYSSPLGRRAVWSSVLSADRADEVGAAGAEEARAQPRAVPER